eukprot:1188928-Prorocentrum_minimum.AAC.2
MDPTSAVKAFFEAETFVDILSTISTVREACGIQDYGLAFYDGVKFSTSHGWHAKGLWEILDQKIASCPTYRSQIVSFRLDRLRIVLSYVRGKQHGGSANPTHVCLDCCSPPYPGTVHLIATIRTHAEPRKNACSGVLDESTYYPGGTWLDCGGSNSTVGGTLCLWWARDRLGYAPLSSFCLWGLMSHWWKRDPMSLATTCCTCGPLLCRRCERTFRIPTPPRVYATSHGSLMSINICAIELGLKFFYKKFCAGGMDHISIRRMQVILAKLFVILGGRMLLGVAFEGFAPPADSKQKKWGAHLRYSIGLDMVTVELTIKTLLSHLVTR